jgi:hypothetical protein
MTARINVEIVGAKQAIIGLRKVDPELRKAFNRNVKAVVKPVVDAARKEYPQMPLSGMKRRWTPAGRGVQIFPYNQAAARKGLVYKIDTSRKATALIKIQQKNAAAVAFEVTGKGGSTGFSRRLSAFSGPAIRVMWPTYMKHEKEVLAEIEKLVLEASRIVEKELG